jgi:hypothetical protein
MLGGCASRPPITLTEPIGPAIARPAMAENDGHLKVYSMAYLGSMDADIERYVHSSYTIYAPDGAKVRLVSNQTGLFNEDPETVTLPEGKYQVKAETYQGKWVLVPVVVERARTTVVDLNDEWWRDHPLADRAVKLPGGSVIGAEVREDSGP